MKRSNKVSGTNRQLSLSGFRGFVNFALAIAAVWVVLLLAPQGFATTGSVNSSNAVVCTLNAVDVGANSGCISNEVKSQVFMSGLTRCCEQIRDHQQMPESCQTPCPASGYTLSAIWDWQLPAHILPAMKFAPRVIGAPNSLLHQRLNRPPITGPLA